MFKKVCSIVLAVLMLATMFTGNVFAAGSTASGNTSTYVGEVGSYSYYLNTYKNVTKKVPTITIDATVGYEAVDRDGNVKESVVVNEYDGKNGLYIDGDHGSVTWKFTVEKKGMYQLKVDYRTVEGKSSSIERKLYIDGEVPFDEASSLAISRVWKNESDVIEQDNRGNDKYPTQVEVFGWYEQYFRDASGYYDNYLLFYLTEGEHTITLETIKEPIVIGSLTFDAQKTYPSYSDAIATYTAQGYKEVAMSEPIKVQAELADLKSSAQLAPIYDRSSPLLEPYDGTKLRMNILGGGRFNSANMWVEYDIDNVPADGLYKIVFKVKQETARGLNITRRLYVNGAIPFKEAANISFEYTSGYKNIALGEGEVTYLIPLKKGQNTIRIESALGELGDYIMEVSDILEKLNEYYRKIIVITGTTPDAYRSYDLDVKIPEVIEGFGEESVRLMGVANKLIADAGASSYTAILENVARQLERLNKKPHRITKELSDFNSNLSAIGTWISNVKQTDMSMDYFLICSADTEIPRAAANFFESFAHESRNFFVSFFEDYNSIGDTITDTNKVLEVWINSGRDQATILKQLVDSDFSYDGYRVQVKVVQGALLQATVAGQAPDIALYMAQGDPINYAIRSAVVDLSQFSDFEEVKNRFAPAAMAPLELNGKYYGIPEQMSFPVLFYRKDILEQLGFDGPPETWEEVYEMLPVLQRNNMIFGLPTSDVPAGSNEGMISFGTMLYQAGGSFYNEDKSRADFSSEISIQIMKQWSDLYTSYGFPLSYNFSNRFVTGEMPLAVANYTSYNTLVIFAPQLKGMWGIAMVPGTAQEDGTVSHATPVTITTTMMMGSIEESKKQAGWEFIKWWTDTKAQTDYAHELENLLGESGRYPTANLEAMNNISWNVEDLEVFNNQAAEVFGIPEVPGGYYLWRHLDNAFREIYNNGTDPREAMVDYNIIINNEIITKREEFGME